MTDDARPHHPRDVGLVRVGSGARIEEQHEPRRGGDVVLAPRVAGVAGVRPVGAVVLGRDRLGGPADEEAQADTLGNQLEQLNADSANANQVGESDTNTTNRQ